MTYIPPSESLTMRNATVQAVLAGGIVRVLSPDGAVREVPLYGTGVAPGQAVLLLVQGHGTICLAPAR